MSSAPKQPPRDEALRLLRALPEPVSYDVEQGLARHRQQVSQHAALPDWAHELPAVGGPASGLRALRGVLLGTLVGLMFVAGYLLLSPESTQLVPTSRLPVTVATPAAEPAPPQTPELPSPATGERRVSVESLAPPAVAPGLEMRVLPPSGQAERVPTSPRMSARPAATRPRSNLQAAVAPATTTPRPPVTAQPEPADTTAPTPALPREPEQIEPVHVPRPQLEPDQPEVLAEMEQLRMAEQQLAQKPERTLAIVRAGFQRFRPGYLNQERRYLEVMALLGLGQVADARLLGRQFLRDYPAGPYRRKVESALAR